MTTPSADPHVDDEHGDEQGDKQGGASQGSDGRGKRTALNWILAILTLPGALAVVGYAYLQVLASAGCTGRPCSGLGPSETVFALILYGAPVLTVVAIVLSFFTAHRRGGIAVPAIAWTLLAAATLTLVLTF